MHRIDGAGATGENLFTEGDPSQAVPATTVTATWLNTIQEEIAAAVEDAEIVLDKEDNAQLLAAINVLAGRHGHTTGDVKLSFLPAAAEGWIVADDGSIGPVGSGATTRAANDTEALYKLLWDNVSDTWAPVSGGRGADADDDWGAGKTITVPRMLGRALAIAGTGTDLTARTLGEWLGEEEHTLTIAEIPEHDHPYTRVTGGGDQGGGGSAAHSSTSDVTETTGDGDPHNIMQPTTFLHAHIKL